jgi:hypothetical protein
VPLDRLDLVHLLKNSSSFTCSLTCIAVAAVLITRHLADGVCREADPDASPVEGDSADWGLSLLVAGHDVEIKETYRYLLEERKPKLFFDIGANYGTHSLIFLTHGVRTISFEPNLGLRPYFDFSAS